MTVAELIIELRKLDQSTEVWVDTMDGLFPVNGLCFSSDTTIITHSDTTVVSEDILNQEKYDRRS